MEAKKYTFTCEIESDDLDLIASRLHDLALDVVRGQTPPHGVFVSPSSRGSVSLRFTELLSDSR